MYFMHSSPSGKPQIMHIIKFLRKFIDENPLVCCYDEISRVKKVLSERDELKLKQKVSSIVLKVYNGDYFLSTKIGVPDSYPSSSIV